MPCICVSAFEIALYVLVRLTLIYSSFVGLGSWPLDKLPPFIRFHLPQYYEAGEVLTPVVTQVLQFIYLPFQTLP